MILKQLSCNFIEVCYFFKHFEILCLESWCNVSLKYFDTVSVLGKVYKCVLFWEQKCLWSKDQYINCILQWCMIVSCIVLIVWEISIYVKCLILYFIITECRCCQFCGLYSNPVYPLCCYMDLWKGKSYKYGWQLNYAKINFAKAHVTYVDSIL